MPKRKKTKTKKWCADCGWELDSFEKILILKDKHTHHTHALYFPTYYREYVL